MMSCVYVSEEDREVRGNVWLRH